ncbi:hypothetical protein BKA62DRAFT_757542 [Auriculariales sp. MPI-PUGE-AT-0066]|nr:hypothetical protein BKA62DRAFT_757542 [Auriculariales sp. MPI-PUGE-AT-0066]
MRIRVSTTPPLPAHKAWSLIPPSIAEDTSATVREAKQFLCSSVNALDGHELGDIALFVDGFELLDDTALEVLQAGDLVVIKSILPRTGDKRKRRDSETLSSQSPAKRTRLLLTNGSAKSAPSQQVKKPVALSSTASSSSSASSSSELDSDSDSSSSSSSAASSSSSSSSSSSAPSVAPTTRPATTTALDPLKGYSGAQKPVAPAQAHVPPGHGKAATQARNARRRRQRQLGQPSLSGDTGSDLPPAQQFSEPVAPKPAALPVQITSTMLRNKTNRKSFLSDAPKELPTKITFGGTHTPQGSRRTSVAVPRLVPLSERNNLPQNLFVTSVDVEADLWPKRKRKKQPDHFSFTRDHREEQEQQEEFPQLSYGEELDITDAAPAARPRAAVPEISLEVKWPTLKRVIAPPPVGTMLAWQELGINPTTLSPEMLIQTGTVVSLDAVAQVVRLSITRADIAFGATLQLDDEADIGEVEDRDEIEERDIPLADMVGQDAWRVVA